MTNYFVVSDSWEMAQIYHTVAVICQDQQGTKMEVQMIKTLALCMNFEQGLIKKQHGDEVPIGSH